MLSPATSLGNVVYILAIVLPFIFINAFSRIFVVQHRVRENFTFVITRHRNLTSLCHGTTNHDKVENTRGLISSYRQLKCNVRRFVAKAVRT